ncbi:hypothetical protein RRG08_008614 [Elysia crispata]|uniref:Uncharacterized protein n=1 Tax=Elysia crispata TaxID=231223 RepID=A0AAE1B7X0_9GAST|nr:hypothetical protein RRG08_008614 [Elysia crispata]
MLSVNQEFRSLREKPPKPPIKQLQLSVPGYRRVLAWACQFSFAALRLPDGAQQVVGSCLPYWMRRKNTQSYFRLVRSTVKNRGSGKWKFLPTGGGSLVLTMLELQKLRHGFVSFFFSPPSQILSELRVSFLTEENCLDVLHSERLRGRSKS